MIIKVIGKRRGVSKKSGKKYLQVAYLAPMNGGEGQAGDSLFLDPEEYEYSDIRVGQEFEAEFSRRGFLMSFRQVD